MSDVSDRTLYRTLVIVFHYILPIKLSIIHYSLKYVIKTGCILSATDIRDTP